MKPASATPLWANGCNAIAAKAKKVLTALRYKVDEEEIAVLQVGEQAGQVAQMGDEAEHELVGQRFAGGPGGELLGGGVRRGGGAPRARRLI